MPMRQSRRRFLTTLSMAGAAGLVRVPLAQAAEGTPETTTVRIFANRPGICVAPQSIAEPLLRAEGFTDVHFVGLTAMYWGATQMPGRLAKMRTLVVSGVPSAACASGTRTTPAAPAIEKVVRNRRRDCCIGIETSRFLDITPSARV